MNSAFSQETVSPHWTVSPGKGEVALWRVTAPSGGPWPMRKLPLLSASLEFHVISKSPPSPHSTLLRPPSDTLPRTRHQRPEISMLMMTALLWLLLLTPDQPLPHVQTVQTVGQNSRSPNQSNRCPRKCTAKHHPRITSPDLFPVRLAAPFVDLGSWPS